MAPTREQAALRAREAVRLLLGALQESRVVARFVDTYAAAHHRPGLKTHPAAHRDLLLNLRREALLALCSRISGELPRRIAGRVTKQLKSADATAIDAFRAEFFVQLAAALKWSQVDLEEFWSDLDLYAQIAARQPAPMRSGKASRGAAGPFVDRCALLLDPSMFEQARRAAGKFLGELNALAEKTLKQAFAARRKKGGLF
ncbi:MAG: hypothetical protein HY234_02780 [Acidobacteria bacterium]|nr:hypothetical protein [Acidobacteriota bacterium]MBI3661960.1 hypothetical protein [Acidobacteriota bacterium]